MSPKSLLPLWALAVLALGSCFDIGDPSKLCFSCTPGPGSCPDGSECDPVEKVCRPGGCPLPDSGLGLDGGSSKIPANCAYYSKNSPKFIYCQGKFAAGQGPSLCPAGYHICSPADTFPPSLIGACQDITLPGFFVANVPSNRNPANAQQGSCSSVAGWSPAFSGCGVEKKNSTYTGPTCSGFPLSLLCSASNGFTCTGADISTVANTLATNGVSCCS